MLFSSSEVARFINATFEPVWESVRTAPLVTIDFGNGHVVKRTLQGNVATYVCGPDGTIYDVLPGIYAPDVYVSQLTQCRASYVALRPKTTRQTTPGAKRRVAVALTERLRTYHLAQARRLTVAPQPPPQMQAVAAIGGTFKGGGAFGGGAQFAQFNGFGGGIGQLGGFGGFPPPGGLAGTGIGGGGFGGGIEGPTERVIAGIPPVVAPSIPSGPLAERPELNLDSEVNERIRRKVIHEELARRGLVRPDDFKTWLYKEVLHADLDDPLLGLGPVLHANYPFAEEDRAVDKKR